MKPGCGPCRASRRSSEGITLGDLLRFLLALGVVVAAAVLAARAEAPTDADLQQLVKQLGDDDFVKREAATKRLAALGEPAADALGKATKSNDAEVRKRAGDLLAAFDAKLYGEVACFRGHKNGVTGVAFSLDGKRVLSCGLDNTSRLWDLESREEVRAFKGSGEAFSGAAWSRDGKTMVSGGDGPGVREYATPSRVVQPLRGKDNLHTLL